MDVRKHELSELAALFLRLGATAFGGPAAHIAMMEDEVVTRRGWLSREEFLDLLGATNLIPGPNSTELAIHIGLRRAGWLGLVVAGVCFILPAALLVLGLAAAYVHWGQSPRMEGVLFGIKPVILAVVFQALWRLGKSALKSRALVVVGVMSVVANVLGGHELLVLLSAGVLSGAWLRSAHSADGIDAPRPAWLPAGPSLVAAGAVVPVAATASLTSIFGFFLKVGSVLFGSGYVLLAFLRADLVERWGWLSEAQLLDAIAIGQFTPGPVFTTATFIGYLLGDIPGALAATAGIFLPAFCFVAISGPLIPLLRRSPLAGAFLDGLNAASLALMLVVTLRLAHGAVMNPAGLLLAAVSGVFLFKTRVNSAWLVLGGALVGIFLHPWGG